MTAASEAVLRNAATVTWIEGPGHHGGALSKILVAAEPGGSRLVDYRISSYAPGAHVARHKHEAKEQIYHVLEGEGLLELGEATHVVRAGDVALIPPHVPHALQNTGLGRLVFIVVTVPL
ncbi:cupin domain-containing protein [Falsiroseomonas oryzae]|uniref:cupin domain-containing protein n=1 Tax=Falsiroseomonas oryzae TaxID=2766473 RepID=UPI0022EB9578|nr:cupin domain-containing protein [Roseomonas sp. MO-31]